MINIAHYEALGHPVGWANSLGLHPVYFNDQNKIPYAKIYFHDFRKISQEIWGMLNYAGMVKPWHDEHTQLYPGMEKSFNNTFNMFERTGIDWRSYCYLFLPLMDWQKWDSPTALFSDKSSHSWMKKLYKEFQQPLVSQIVVALYHFLRLQYQYYGEMSLIRKHVIKKDVRSSGQCADGYHRLGFKIMHVTSLGVPFENWLEKKMRNFYNFQPTSVPILNTILNQNGLDPCISELKSEISDPWNDIRTFLGLGHDCRFPDGSIPKGWQPIADEYIDISRIKVVHKDGHYMLEDGSQRRGKYHYMKNTYLAIKCTPDNFAECKNTWKDPRLFVSAPTWEEYKRSALHPDLWDAEGNATNGKSKPVKWRIK